MITIFRRVGCDLRVLFGVVVCVSLSDEPVVYVCFGWYICISVHGGDVGKIGFQAEVM